MKVSISNQVENIVAKGELDAMDLVVLLEKMLTTQDTG